VKGVVTVEPDEGVAVGAALEFPEAREFGVFAVAATNQFAVRRFGRHARQLQSAGGFLHRRRIDRRQRLHGLG
jgi:hypothetical protein